MVDLVSHGILKQLKARGVAEASILAMQLGSSSGNLTALSQTLAESNKEHERGIGWGIDRSANLNAQAGQEKSLLARAAGETAVAVVASVLTPDKFMPLAASSREAVSEYGAADRTGRGGDLLENLLEQAETAVQHAKGD